MSTARLGREQMHAQRAVPGSSRALWTAAFARAVVPPFLRPARPVLLAVRANPARPGHGAFTEVHAVLERVHLLRSELNNRTQQRVGDAVLQSRERAGHMGARAMYFRDVLPRYVANVPLSAHIRLKRTLTSLQSSIHSKFY